MNTRVKMAEPSDSAKVVIRTVLTTINLMNAADTSGKRTTLTSNHIRAFLIVALKPGLSVSEIAAALGWEITGPTSRILLEIGKRGRSGQEGLGLVAGVSDNADLRIVHYYLTTTGDNLLSRILKTMGVK